MIHADHMIVSPLPASGGVLCQGNYTTDEQRNMFLLRNSIDGLAGLLCSEESLYGSVGFPFAQVESILSSTERINFLYILINSPMEENVFIYDEYIFKNFPCTTKLLKQFREGGDTFVYRKQNRDVLFVKFHNIYEQQPFLHIPLI